MTSRQIGYLLLAAGIVIALLAVLIDPLRGYDVHLATVQIVALVAGVLIALAGLFVGFLRG